MKGFALEYIETSASPDDYIFVGVLTRTIREDV